MRKLIFLILFSSLFLSYNSIAQKSDSTENYYNDFINDFEKWMGDFLTYDQVETVEKFVDKWFSDTLFTTMKKDTFIYYIDKFKDKKARPVPHIINYLKCYSILDTSSATANEYISWYKALDFILSSDLSLGTLSLFLENSQWVFKSKILYQSASVQWLTSARGTFMFENETPYFNFENTTLSCLAKRDSILIFDTKGRYNILDNSWNGESGKVTWERAGFPADSMYALLDSYNIDFKGSEYKAENVAYTNLYFFEDPLVGNLEDKVKYVSNPSDATYPKFNSKQNKFEIDNIYPDVNYIGGMRMEGAKIIGAGTEGNYANLNFYLRDTLVLKTASNYYVFKEDRVIGIDSKISILFERDSIYHPNLRMLYMVKAKELSLDRTDNFVSKGPYFNSYHNVEMDFEQLRWRIGEDKLLFTMLPGRTMGQASFESINFFNKRKFDELSMRDVAHPLLSLRACAKKLGRDWFTVEEFADHTKYSLTSTRHRLMTLAEKGFIYYDFEKELVRVKQKTYDYVFANFDRIDYDVINIQSNTYAPKENASLNLNNFDLTVNGTPKVFLSDSQNVAIFPAGDKIVLKRNRSFVFDGVISAGLFTFYGNNFFFSYDDFSIQMQAIDSLVMRYRSEELDNFGIPVIKRVESNIESLTGDLFIDKSDNKSGRFSQPEYPIFKSREKSRIYYDDLTIEEGVYSRDKFYFELDTFEYKNLDYFKKEDLIYNGVLYSANILPPLREKVSIQPDNSLGFVHNTDDQPLPIYGGKAKLANDIILDNSGLHADGTMHYLTSTTYSKEFKFYPDSMNTNSIDFQVDKTATAVEYPYVSSSNNKIHFLPYQDKLFSSVEDVNFTMYNDTTKLKGQLLLQPTGLTGKGLMDMKNSELNSRAFTFNADEFYSDSANFYLKSLNMDGYTVLTSNVNAHVNYKDYTGTFKSNEDFSLVEFPENKYVSYIDYFKWYMKETRLRMGNPADITPLQKDILEIEDKDLIGPYYISIHRDQDSIGFISPLANYNYNTNIINASDVRYVKVGDTKIYPPKGELKVEVNARITPFNDAMILANRTSKFHLIYDASVSIYGKNDYSASGLYDYLDELGEKQVIKFKDITLDTANNTIATGSIPLDMDFTLSPNFKYRGEVNLFAPIKHLNFNGGFQLTHDCDTVPLQWVDFESFINPDSIIIPISEKPKNIDRNNIYNGILMANDSIHIYSAFLAAHKNYSDNYLISSSGKLYYDKISNSYKITSEEKLNDFTLPDDYISFNKVDCEHYGEGKVDLGTDLGQLKLKNWGKVRRMVQDNETTLELFSGMNFFISPEALALMAHDFDSLPGTENLNLDDPLYQKGLESIFGRPVIAKLNNELQLFGEFREMPEQLKYTIHFNNLKLKWNDASNSYQSYGEIGILSIGGVQINKTFEGFLEIVRKRSGDLLDLYLKMDNNNWYYFGYSRGVMQTISSNQEYVELIKNLKVRDRKMKDVKRGETSYIYMISTNRKYTMFLRRWEEALSED